MDVEIQDNHLNKRAISQYLDLIPAHELVSIKLKLLVPESAKKRLLDEQ